ncbi:MAG: hypothetical protein JJE40_09820 [Vicinamibacteria bacterium]|nr:hypothetical protein [Vicinamibacteria bacterium]
MVANTLSRADSAYIVTGRIAESSTGGSRSEQLACDSGTLLGGIEHALPRGMRTGPLTDITISAARHTIGLVEALPRQQIFYRLGGQLLDSGTSQARNVSSSGSPRVHEVMARRAMGQRDSKHS